MDFGGDIIDRNDKYYRSLSEETAQYVKQRTLRYDIQSRAAELSEEEQRDDRREDATRQDNREHTEGDTGARHSWENIGKGGQGGQGDEQQRGDQRCVARNAADAFEQLASAHVRH